MLERRARMSMGGLMGGFDVPDECGESDGAHRRRPSVLLTGAQGCPRNSNELSVTDVVELAAAEDLVDRSPRHVENDSSLFRAEQLRELCEGGGPGDLGLIAHRAAPSPGSWRRTKRPEHP